MYHRGRGVEGGLRKQSVLTFSNYFLKYSFSEIELLATGILKQYLIAQGRGVIWTEMCPQLPKFIC